jgi:hypothetical protein
MAVAAAPDHQVPLLARNRAAGTAAAGAFSFPKSASRSAAISLRANGASLTHDRAIWLHLFTHRRRMKAGEAHRGKRM